MGWSSSHGVLAGQAGVAVDLQQVFRIAVSREAGKPSARRSKVGRGRAPGGTIAPRRQLRDGQNMPTTAVSLTAADHAELLTLYARSARLIDAGENEAWADLYTPDGVFERQVSPMPGIEAVYVEGREALARFATGVVRRGGGRHRHWLSGILPGCRGPGRGEQIMLLPGHRRRGAGPDNDPRQRNLLGTG